MQDKSGQVPYGGLQAGGMSRSFPLGRCVLVFVYTTVGTKTIGLREEVYERLKPRKREGFGTLPDSAAEALEDAASASR